MFKEIYSGERAVLRKKDSMLVRRKVYCILDDNCVRYSVIENGRKVRVSEFSNNEKKKCFEHATRALNRE